MITTRHSPGDPRIFEKEARSLKNLGYEVDIVVPQEELPDNTYGINFLTFDKAPGLFRKISTLIRTFQQSKSSQAQIYHCHEIDASLFIGYLLKKRMKSQNVKLIFDCHEFWLGYFKSCVPKFFRWLFHLFFVLYEKVIIKHCDAIITANSIERGYYQILFPTKEIQIIYNTPHFSEIASSKPSQIDFDLCFEGVMNLVRGEKILFELIKHLKKNYKDIKLLILGAIQKGESYEWAKSFIAENSLEENIIITGWQPYNALYSFHTRSKIGIYLYQHTPNNLLAGPPNKLFNYMKAGIPIIASNLPETSNILNEIECGISVDPTNFQEIEKAILLLLKNPEISKKMGEKGLQAFKEKYNWKVEEKKLQSIYEKILIDSNYHP